MFERNRVDNTRERGAVAAAVELSDGRRITGRFMIPLSKNLYDILNGPDAFVEFEPYEGERELLAKSALRSVRMIKVPGVGKLDAHARDLDGFNPYQILGLEKGATKADVRRAFLQHSKRYHPDRYANAELPEEVRGYLQAMARRVNTAYELATEAAERNDEMARRRTAPIYESRRAV